VHSDGGQESAGEIRDPGRGITGSSGGEHVTIGMGVDGDVRVNLAYGMIVDVEIRLRMLRLVKEGSEDGRRKSVAFWVGKSRLANSLANSLANPTDMAIGLPGVNHSPPVR
jgi:hypothetical protein